jgi:hypothetical protein
MDEDATILRVDERDHKPFIPITSGESIVAKVSKFKWIHLMVCTPSSSSPHLIKQI